MSDFIEALKIQKQLDADGCMVGVSRQAIDEALTEISRLTASLAEAREVMKESEKAHRLVIDQHAAKTFTGIVVAADEQYPWIAAAMRSQHNLRQWLERNP